MKNYVYIILCLSIVANIAIFIGLPSKFISISSINFNELDGIKEELDNKFNNIINDTGADTAWISIFHSVNGRALKETEVFALPSLRFDPLYESTLHFLNKNENIFEYQPKFNEPILAINRISETLSGNCVSQVMPINNIHSEGISYKKFIVRCPLIYDKKVVGSYGIVIFNMDLLDLSEKSNSLPTIIQNYNSNLVEILFK